MIASGIWYLAFLLAVCGALAIVRPARRWGIRSRRRGFHALVLSLFLLATLFVTAGWEHRVADPVSQLDRVVPIYQFVEFHDTDVAATPAATWRAIQEVTPREIRFYRVLTWMRRGGRTGPPSIMNPPPDVPLLKTALETSFRALGETPEREIVFGGFVVAPAGAGSRRWTTDLFAGLEEPGFAKVAMNFKVEPTEGGTRLSTETRVYATDASTRRLFAAYWRTIYPGSAIIRRSWLTAITARAEGAATTQRR